MSIFPTFITEKNGFALIPCSTTVFKTADSTALPFLRCKFTKIHTHAIFVRNHLSKLSIHNLSSSSLFLFNIIKNFNFFTFIIIYNLKQFP